MSRVWIGSVAPRRDDLPRLSGRKLTVDASFSWSRTTRHPAAWSRRLRRSNSILLLSISRDSSSPWRWIRQTKLQPRLHRPQHRQSLLQPGQLRPQPTPVSQTYPTSSWCRTRASTAACFLPRPTSGSSPISNSNSRDLFIFGFVVTKRSLQKFSKEKNRPT